MEGLRHDVPAICSNNVSEIIKLRESEEETFKVYRDCVHNLVKKADGCDKKQISEMFKDQVLPELNKLDKTVKDWKSSLENSVFQKLLFGVGTVSIGMYSGVLPFDTKKIIAAFDGFTGITKEQQEARKNGYYFLWRIGK